MITLTEEMIRVGESSRGGYNKKQLAILGIDWPPTKGWKSSMIGKSITEETYQHFIEAKKI